MNRSIIGTILAASLTLSACGRGAPEEEDGAARLVGLAQGDNVTFTRTPDGGALSLLYDNAVLAAATSDAKLKEGDSAPMDRRFTLVAAGSPASARFWVRGFRSEAAKTATLAFVAKTAAAIDLTPQIADENFTACFDLALDSAETPIQWKAAVAVPPAGETAELHIDSIDIGLLAKDSPPLVSGTCPEAPPRP